jgi:hypothetical protein
MTKVEKRLLKLLDRQVSLLEDIVDDLSVGRITSRRAQTLDIREALGKLRNEVNDSSA